jgi:mono/diheme cytochrome c family protein
MVAIAGSLATAVAGVYAVIVLVPGGFSVNDSTAFAATLDTPPPAAVAPFGMAARSPVPQQTQVASASGGRFTEYCSGCHGADRRGLPGLGVNLAQSTFVTSSSAADLSAFLRKGRAPGDKGNVTGRPMPAFEWLGDQTLAEIAAELKNWSG